MLTRLISEANGVWEYTRFLAERNSVVRNEEPRYLLKLQAPTSAEYPSNPHEEEAGEGENAVREAEPARHEADGHTEVADSNVNRALRNIANQEYEPAIEFFASVVAQRPDYHTAWLRLGHSQRELAMRKRFADPPAAAELFARSIESLTRAADHSHPSHQAQAHYERSKAYFHRARLTEGDARLDDLNRSRADAETAYARERETRYETWIDYLNQHLQ